MKKYATAISAKDFEQVKLHVETGYTNADSMRILGINFYNGPVKGVVEFLKKGGLLVVPAAPALITVKKDPVYYKSLLDADVVIPDSGFMTIVWRFIQKERINRISGLEFLKAFFNDEQIKKESDLILVDPTPKEAEANHKYLTEIGFNISRENSYIAPMYAKNKVEDENLLNIIKNTRPKYIIINLGGGTQEKLGAYLKKNVGYKPAIICTGAAIAFLTGQQAEIPDWADRWFFGWLFRCFEKPKVYVPRYLKAFKLVSLIVKYGKNSPVNKPFIVS